MTEAITQYIATALWSSNDDKDEPLDKNYGPNDIHPDTLAKMTADVCKFLKENEVDIGDRYEDAGHDFWLTRNSHGSGFWDGDWPEGPAKRLTESSKRFGEVYLYVGDDGKIHA